MTSEKNLDPQSPYITGQRVLPLMNSVIFPHIIFPVLVDEDHQKDLIADAEKDDKIVCIFPEKKAEDVSETMADILNKTELMEYGVRCRVLKHFITDNGDTRIIFHGLERIRRIRFEKNELSYKTASVEIIEDIPGSEIRAEAYRRSISELFQRIIGISPLYPEEVQDVILSVENPGKLADLVSATLDLPFAEKYKLLTEFRINKRLDLLIKALRKELKVLELNEKINDSVRNSFNRQQREFLLREQMDVIKKELGEADDEDADIQEIRDKMDNLILPEEAQNAIEKEIERLAMTSPYASDYSVSKNYIDWLVSLPWGIYTKDRLTIQRSSKILEKDHYGLQDVKDRILEYLAVLQLKKDAKSPILCLVGPPGVGKTSLGQSIARAMNRKFIRFSVGGMRDEAEIRGHRKTYVGAMPGRIIQYLKRCESQNPLIMLDEVDKIGNDFRGDPASALLEVLDPEQNKDFRDNYLEVAFDLSKVFFIATANSTHSIPPALLDRMEIIEIPGYITPEKEQIAKRYLVPRQIEANGLDKKRISFTKQATVSIIENYTLEAGVRQLEKQIAKICRKTARRIAAGTADEKQLRITGKNLPEFLGPQLVFNENLPQKPECGIAIGLAYTTAGGDVLPVEATLMTGSGIVKNTGQLGDVMKESVETAISFLRSSADTFGIEKVDFFQNDFHLHFPAAAIPKDGPSAGITITTALLSCLRRQAVRHDVAMTGEISLRGRILPIGGVREKVTAARRMGIKTVILPTANEADLVKVPSHIKEDMKFIFVNSYFDVVDYVFDQ